MEHQVLLPDSLGVIRQTIEVVSPAQTTSMLDIICTIATVLIALVNVGLVIYIFVKNNENNTLHKEKSRKIKLLKTLVLDYGMDYFYEFFKNLDKEVIILKNSNLDDPTKQTINANLLSLGETLEHKFTDLFLGIDQRLYESIKQETDILLDGFTESIFNENINIYTEDNFNNLITSKIVKNKTQILKILFSYTGE